MGRGVGGSEELLLQDARIGLMGIAQAKKRSSPV